MQSSLPAFYSSNFPPNSPFPSTETAATQNHLAPIISATKRNQVKNACTNCQKACKKCADERPCPRCTKYGISDTCVSSVRKERKKGIKRGPYKRRQKSTDDKIENKDTPELLVAALDAATANTASIVSTTVASTTATSTAATTPSTTAADYGYPTQLSQYAQYYGYHPNNENEKILSTQYVLPVYSGYPPPVLVDGDTTPQGNTESKDENKENTPEEGTNSTSYLAHQALSIILNSANNESNNGIYYPTNTQEKEKQPLTPVPSTSNTSGTVSPSETHDDEEKFNRLTELCTAALRENLDAKEVTESSNDIATK